MGDGCSELGVGNGKAKRVSVGGGLWDEGLLGDRREMHVKYQMNSACAQRALGPRGKEGSTCQG